MGSSILLAHARNVKRRLYVARETRLLITCTIGLQSAAMWGRWLRCLRTRSFISAESQFVVEVTNKTAAFGFDEPALFLKGIDRIVCLQLEGLQNFV